MYPRVGYNEGNALAQAHEPRLGAYPPRLLEHRQVTRSSHVSDWKDQKNCCVLVDWKG
jgi:hypothetical protein